jgi:hypothetical protein
LLGIPPKSTVPRGEIIEKPSAIQSFYAAIAIDKYLPASESAKLQICLMPFREGHKIVEIHAPEIFRTDLSFALIN